MISKTKPTCINCLKFDDECNCLQRINNGDVWWDLPKAVLKRHEELLKNAINEASYNATITTASNIDRGKILRGRVLVVLLGIILVILFLKIIN